MDFKSWEECFPLFISILITYVLYLIIRGGRPRIVRSLKEKYYEAPDGHYLLPSILEEATVDLSVVVPACNEETRLPEMLEDVLNILDYRQRFSMYDYKFEVIIVDDASSDNTAAVALKYSVQYGTEKVRIIRLCRNRGKGGAVRIGMISARGKYLVMVDGDGSARFSDYDVLQEKLNEINTHEHGMAIVVGSRAHMQLESIASQSLIRIILMRCYRSLVWFLCVRTVGDTQCGFKLFTRTAARNTFLNIHIESWAFDVEVLYIAERLKIPIVEVGVRWTEVAGSKFIPVLSSIRMGVDILLIWIHHVLRIWRIHKFLN